MFRILSVSTWKTMPLLSLILPAFLAPAVLFQGRSRQCLALPCRGQETPQPARAFPLAELHLRSVPPPQDLLAATAVRSFWRNYRIQTTPLREEAYRRNPVKCQQEAR